LLKIWRQPFITGYYDFTICVENLHDIVANL